MSKVFLLFICIFFSWANEIVVDQNFTSLSSIGYQKVLYSKQYDSNKMKQSEQLTVSYTDVPVWTEFDLRNTLSVPIELWFTTSRSGMDYIDIEIFHENRLVEHIAQGDHIPIHTKKIEGKQNDFSFVFEPNKSYKIITKYQSKGPLNITWNIQNKKNYNQTSIRENVFWGFFVGLIFAVAIYNLSLYYSIKEKILLFYVFHFIIITFTNLGRYGVLYQLDIQFGFIDSEYISWVFPFILTSNILILWILFFQLYTKKSAMIKLIYYFLVFNGLYVIYLSLFVFGFETFSSVKYVSAVTGVVFIFLFFYLMYFTMKERYRGSIPFNIGQFMLMIFPLFQYLSEQNIINYGYMGLSLVGLGALFEIVLISIAFQSKVIKIREENEQNKLLILEHEKYANVGSSILSLSHQWKKPINNIVNHLTHIQLQINKEDNKLYNKLKEEFSVVNANTTFIADSVNTFLKFYTNKNSVESIELHEIVENLKVLYSDTIQENNINIYNNINNPTIIKTDKNGLINIMTIIIENSFDVFKQSNLKEKKVEVIFGEEKEFWVISIKNNGKKIGVKPIQKIFEFGYSEKEKGFGVGLFLAKKLAVDTLKGDIYVYNSTEYVTFEIKMKKN